MGYSHDDEILDRPPPAPEYSRRSEPDRRWHHLITLLLFPAALLRLRVDHLDWRGLILGGLGSSLQFLAAGLILAGLKILYAHWRNPTEKTISWWRLSLQSAVELLILVGLAQLLWTWLR